MNVIRLEKIWIVEKIRVLENRKTFRILSFEAQLRQSK